MRGVAALLTLLVTAVGARETATPRLVVQAGHHKVWQVTIGPTGDRAASVGTEGRLVVWDLATGRQTLRAPCHRGTVGLQWRDSGRLTALCEDGTGHEYDPADGRELRTWGWHDRDDSGTLACTDDQRLALVRWSFRGLRLVETATGREVGRMPAAADETIHQAAMSADGQVVAYRTTRRATSDAATLHVWDFRQQRELLRREQPKSIRALAVSADGALVVAGVQDTAVLWEVAKGTELDRLDLKYGCWHARFSPDGNWLAVASVGELRWRRTAGSKPWQERRGAVECLAFDRDSQRVLWGGDGAFGCRELVSGREQRTGRGPQGAVTGVYRATDGGRLLIVKKGEGSNAASLWDLENGQRLRVLGPHCVERAALSGDGQTAAWGGDNIGDEGRGLAVVRLDEPAADVLYLPQGRALVTAVALSHDGAWLAMGHEDGTAEVFATRAGVRPTRLPAQQSRVSGVALSRDGTRVVTVTEEGHLLLADTATGQAVRQGDWLSQLRAPAFSPDGRLVYFAGYGGLTVGDQPSVWDLAGGNLQALPRTRGCWNLALSTDGRRLLAAGAERLNCLDAASGEAQWSVPFRGDAVCADARRVFAGDADGLVHVLDAATGTELCAICQEANGRLEGDPWAVVAPDGRFDTADLEEVHGLNWVMSDAPFVPLPLEIFMRDYYEPRLLAKVWQGAALQQLPNVAGLNRVQPAIRIEHVETIDRDRLAVTVAARAATRTERRAGRDVTVRAVPHDLRLFRDGQLAAHVDGPLPLDATGCYRQRLAVRVAPAGPLASDLELMAYCFNDDRVKSATARAAHHLDESDEVPRGRAVVIAVGVDRYSHPGWSSLAYAAADARASVAQLTEQLRQTALYEAVLGVSLLADDTRREASKASFKLLLDRLAGRDADGARLKILGAEDLQPARPQDLLIITWSGHGVADEQGVFYLIPCDTAATGAATGAAALATAVSSDELSEWLRDVDAGDVAMVIDACQSSASVEGKGFKPGPMGSRGLGQLAYDKGMAVLAASQADRPAAESGRLQHGLLTYALVEEGLKAKRAARDGQVTLAGWLAYGAGRVPAMCAELKAGTFRPVDQRGAKPGWSPGGAAQTQRPGLFSFRKGLGERVLARVGRN